MTERELYWLAGLLEGEGSFMTGPPSSPNSVRISLAMTDEDVVARVASLWKLGYNIVQRERHKQRNWKPYYYVHIRGKRAVDLMERLLPLMGKRRQSQIERALASYNPYLRYKVTPAQVAEIRLKLEEGLTQSKIARQYGVDRSTIGHIKAGKRSTYR